MLLLLCTGLLSGQDLPSEPDIPRDIPDQQVSETVAAEEPAVHDPAPEEETAPEAEASGPGIRLKRPIPKVPVIPSGPYLPPSQKAVEDQRLDIIRFGTENEIVSLVQTLKNEKVDYLDDALITLVQTTTNRNILAGVFSFFGDRARGGLEDRAFQAVEEWDMEATDTVLAAVDYLGKLKVEAAIPLLRGILEDEDQQRFMSVAVRSLGRIGGGIPHESEEIARYLIDYYTTSSPVGETPRDIIAAVGETGSPAGIEFLSGIIENNDERVPLRIAALEALSKIKDPAGLDAVLTGASSGDPNVRAAAVNALGPFEGPDVTAVILEAFRDSFYRTRINAVQAVGTRKMEIAVPYLAFRVERDEVPQVKDEAIKALGAIGNREAETVLATFFEERKNSDRIRILTSEMLMRDHAEAYVEKFVVELEDAKKRNQTALYNGFLRVIGSAKAPSLEVVTRRFLTSGGVIEKSYALDMAVNNGFRGLLEEVRALTDPKNGTLARKAQSALEKLDPSAKPVDEKAQDAKP